MSYGSEKLVLKTFLFLNCICTILNRLVSYETHLNSNSDFYQEPPCERNRIVPVLFTNWFSSHYFSLDWPLPFVQNVLSSCVSLSMTYSFNGQCCLSQSWETKRLKLSLIIYHDAKLPYSRKNKASNIYFSIWGCDLKPVYMANY